MSQTRRASQPCHWFMAILKIKKHCWLKTSGWLSVIHTIGAEMSLIIQIPHIVVIVLNMLPYPSNIFISPALFCSCQYIKNVTQGIQNSNYLLPVKNSIWIIFMTQFQHTHSPLDIIINVTCSWVELSSFQSSLITSFLFFLFNELRTFRVRLVTPLSFYFSEWNSYLE